MLYLGDCLEVMRTLPDASVHCIITDPPYPEIDRAYGRMTEAEWWEMMMGVCAETRRLLKPTGSAVFILQPNSRKVGSMRGWLFEFMAWICREWNMVQDVWWWNPVTIPVGGANRKGGLLRSAIKPCVWAGNVGCYRNQDAILIPASAATVADKRVDDNQMRRGPSGRAYVMKSCLSAFRERGGVIPQNVVRYANSRPISHGHSSSTPLELAKWWTRYICPPGGTVLDPFVGSGTMMLAAIEYGCNGIGIERDPTYFAIAQKRIEQAAMQLPLLQAAD